jgi:hypothetical protein
MGSDASASSLRPAAGLTESGGEESVHLAAARRSGVLRCLTIAVPCLYIAALLAKLILNQSHMPSKAGPFLAVAIIGGLALLGLYAVRCALRAAKAGVTTDAAGITIHNLTNTRRIAWSEIARFEAASDKANSPGMASSANPWVAVRVLLRDGNSRWIEGTRLGGAVWRRAQRQEEVDRCATALNNRLDQGGKLADLGTAR